MPAQERISLRRTHSKTEDGPRSTPRGHRRHASDPFSLSRSFGMPLSDQDMSEFLEAEDLFMSGGSLPSFDVDVALPSPRTPGRKHRRTASEPLMGSVHDFALDLDAAPGHPRRLDAPALVRNVETRRVALDDLAGPLTCSSGDGDVSVDAAAFLNYARTTRDADPLLVFDAGAAAALDVPPPACMALDLLEALYAEDRPLVDGSGSAAAVPQGEQSAQRSRCGGVPSSQSWPRSGA